jgi:hypothetical protein
MITNRIFAFTALAGFGAFFGVVIAWVPHVDLVAVIVIGLALASYDIWSQLGPGRGGRSG